MRGAIPKIGFFCKTLEGFISAPVDKNMAFFISPLLIFGRK